MKKKPPQKTPLTLRSIIARKKKITKTFYGAYKHLIIDYTIIYDKKGMPAGYKVVPFLYGERKNGFVIKQTGILHDLPGKTIEEYLYESAHAKYNIKNPQRREFSLD